MEMTDAETEKIPTVPAELPLLPLKDTVVYPLTVYPLVIGKEKSIKLINEVTVGDKILGTDGAEKSRRRGEQHQRHLHHRDHGQDSPDGQGAGRHAAGTGSGDGADQHRPLPADGTLYQGQDQGHAGPVREVRPARCADARAFPNCSRKWSGSCRTCPRSFRPPPSTSRTRASSPTWWRRTSGWTFRSARTSWRPRTSSTS